MVTQSNPEADVANTPLMSDPVLHILLALSDRPRHGYAIAQEIEERTDGEVSLGTSTLYTALKRLRGDGLIREVTDPEPVAGARKRRTYTLTKRGTSMLLEQTQRLQGLFAHAAHRNLLPGIEATP